MKSGIYKITNLINSKLYIGSSANTVNRMSTHYSSLKYGYHWNGHLQKSWDKYGEENFKFEIIEYCEKDKLIEREQYYIDLCNVCDSKNGYNIRTIAESNTGLIFTEEHKKKLSEAIKGYKHTPEALEKMRGRSFTEEHKKKLSESHKGYTPTKETLKKMSESQKGRVMSEENKIKLRKINTGKIISQITRDKIGKSNIGRIAWNKGLKNCFTEETRKKMSVSQTGKKQSKETIEKRVEKLKKYVVSEETKKKISIANKGKSLGHIPWNEGKKLINSTWVDIKVSD